MTAGALLALQLRRRYRIATLSTKGMIRVRVDVFVDVIEGGLIGFTGACTPSDLMWFVLPRRGKGMRVGGYLC